VGQNGGGTFAYIAKSITGASGLYPLGGDILSLIPLPFIQSKFNLIFFSNIKSLSYFSTLNIRKQDQEFNIKDL